MKKKLKKIEEKIEKDGIGKLSWDWWRRREQGANPSSPNFPAPSPKMFSPPVPMSLPLPMPMSLPLPLPAMSLPKIPANIAYKAGKYSRGASKLWVYHMMSNRATAQPVSDPILLKPKWLKVSFVCANVPKQATNNLCDPANYLLLKHRELWEDQVTTKGKWEEVELRTTTMACACSVSREHAHPQIQIQIQIQEIQQWLGLLRVRTTHTNTNTNAINS